LKRCYDIICSAILTIFLSPILLITAIAIWAETGRPIIYKNERIGSNGKRFFVYKFRYMKWEYCVTNENKNIKEALEYEKELIKKQSLRRGPLYKIKNDPRKTRVGAFIERFSIDELPQLFNVLKGEMSLIGPRPHQEREVEKYNEYHRRLLTIKPGVSGMAQVSGRSDLEFENEYKIAKKINGETLRYLGRAALKNDAILIHYSTDYVFGGDTCQDDDCAEECLLEFKEKGGFKENDTPCPINRYGETKLMGENEILKLAERKLKYYIIRTSKLFGPKGKSNDAKENFFDLMLRISQTQNTLKVVGEELSCFTYTPDLAKQTVNILRDKKEWGIYHVRNNDPAIWYDAAVELFRLKGIRVLTIPVSANEFPRPAKRPKYSVLANTKLPALRSWKEALKEYINNIN
jgi:dTDP-4-dehydrorhamnose reductase